MIETDEDLLLQLRRTDAHVAWRLFYDRYWAAILRYGRKIGLSPSQAQDVIQETMVVLMRVLPSFSYSRERGRFRNFLLTIVHRRSLAMLRQARRSDAHRVAEDLAHGAYWEAVEPDREAVRRWQSALAEEALSRVLADEALEQRVRSVFEAYVVQGHAASEVAHRFGVNENAVYQIKSRLLRRLQADVGRQLRDAGDGSH